jgi:tetratricopeptide (TPR) repeat protein
MKSHSFCPRCGNEFNQEHFAAETVICACGWFDDSTEIQATHKIENSTIKAMLVFGVLFTLGFAHVTSWGNHALSIPFTKAAQVTGLLSVDGYRGLAKTCVELNKWSCAEEAYTELAHDRGVVEGYSLAGSLDARLNKIPQAIADYQAYEKAGGNESMAILNYAKILEASGQDNEASRLYEKSIAAKPDALPVQATTGLVRLMIKHGQYVEAYERLLAFHESAENANGYMNTETSQLQKQLGEKVIAQIEKKHASKSVVAN